MAEARDRSEPTAPQSSGVAQGEVRESVLGNVKGERRLHLREEEASASEATGMLGRANVEGVEGLAADDTVFVMTVREVLGHR